MDTSKATVTLNSISGKISSIVGYTLAGFFLLAFFITLTNNDPEVMQESEKATGFVVSIIFILIGVFLIILGAKIKRRIKRFRIYVGLISAEHINSLDSIAKSTSQSVSFVRDDIQKMIDKKFFANAYIDTKTNEVISINKQGEAIRANQISVENILNIKCTGCGAVNSLDSSKVNFCEYCGTALK